jgi:hypothetical protein
VLFISAIVIDAQSTEPIKRPPVARTNPTSIKPLPAKKDQQAKDTAQQTENKDDISKYLSIIASQINSLDSAINRYAAEKEKDSKSTPEVVLNWLTGILAFIAILQLVVFFWQGRQLRKSVEAAEKTAKSMENSERPYIFIKVEAEIMYSNTSQKGYCHGKYFVRNHGKTPAVLTNINVRFWFKSENPPPIEDPTGQGIPSGGEVIDAGDNNGFPIRQDITENEFENIKNVNLKLFCYGRIEYNDIFGVSHYTKFCWEYQPRAIVRSGGFYLSNNKELNDYT